MLRPGRPEKARVTSVSSGAVRPMASAHAEGMLASGVRRGGGGPGGPRGGCGAGGAAPREGGGAGGGGGAPVPAPPRRCAGDGGGSTGGGVCDPARRDNRNSDGIHDRGQQGEHADEGL